jgi:hypothetical protein
LADGVVGFVVALEVELEEVWEVIWEVALEAIRIVSGYYQLIGLLSERPIRPILRRSATERSLGN